MMPIYKYKTFWKVPEANWVYKPDEEYYQRIKKLYVLYSKLSKFRYPHGIYKFKTFEEAEEHKMKVIIESAQSNPHVFYY